MTLAFPLDREEITNDLLRYLHPINALHEEGDVPELAVPLMDGVDLRDKDRDDVVIFDQDVLTFGGGEQVTSVALVGFQFNSEGESQ